MREITEITPAQVARFGEWTRKWIEIGLSTEPADFDRATAAALEAYKLADLARPMVVLRMGSPYAACIGGAMALAMLREIAGNKKKTKQVEAQVRAQVQAQARAQARGSYINLYHGAFYASWSAYVSFFRDVMGWENSVLEKFEIEEELIKSCGWAWWHENVLAISDRPEVIKRDDEGRLHCENGPAVRYRDGWSVYSWHGVNVPEEWVTDPSSVTPKIALTHENVEQRRAACEIVGWDNILRELKAKTIQKDEDPMIGELLEVEIPDIGREKFLRVRCGTGRIFAIPMPPHINTALEGNAWSFGIDGDALRNLEVRT